MQANFSEACERNKAPILTVLNSVFANASQVLEIGSGTAQHAVYFAQHLPHLTWHTCDQPHYLAGIQARLAQHPTLTNLKSPFAFRIDANIVLDAHPWLEDTNAVQIDAVFTANTTHVMQAHEAQHMMRLVGQRLPIAGVFAQYGPFTVDGRHTSDSNAAFDAKIRAKGWGGLRDIAELEQWANAAGLVLSDTVAMPANNQLLVWRKIR